MNKGTEEEFNNFMHRVTEINSIVKKISSEDRQLQNMGLAQADKYLKEAHLDVSQELDERLIKLSIKDDRSVINTRKEEQPTDPNSMSQEAFMKEIERDANKRYEDKRVRKEKSDTVKLQANKAFRRGEYVQALSLYNKAIGHIKDSCVLYTNRALTYMHLDMYTKALEDCDTALRLNRDSLKALLYKSKCYFVLKDDENRLRCIRKALKKYPGEKKIIDDFINNYMSEHSDKICPDNDK